VDISTKFDVGDIAYLAVDARAGKMISLIVEKIEVETMNPSYSKILYTIGSNEKFAKSQAYEGDLLTYAEASVIAEAELEDQIDQIQDEIDNI